jgi:hypothetical protein
VWGFSNAQSPAPAPRSHRGFDRGFHRGDRVDHDHDHRGDDRFDGVGRGFHSSGGTHVTGSFSDGRFGLTFHIGNDPALLHHRKHDGHHDHHHKHRRKVVFVPTYYGYGSFYDPYYYGYGYWPYRSRSLYSQIDGVYVRSQQRVYEESEQAAAEEPREPPTEAEIGAYHLRQDNPQESILRYRQHLADNPDDTEAMRSLAVALLVDGRFTEGHAMMSMAYREDPALADEPLDPAEFFATERDFDRATRRCTIQANSARISGAYLTVTVLMQADGNHDAALRVLEKARREGLEVEVADALKRALGG